jgi:GIY-YIG catalytic domain
MRFNNFCYSGIYCIQNQVTKRSYVGCSDFMAERLESHYSGMKNLTHKKDAINQDVEIYGIESFRFGVLEYFDHWIEPIRSEREKVEKEWMMRIKPEYNSPSIVSRSQVAPEYIWRNFDPKNPWRRRQNPSFVAEFDFFRPNLVEPWQGVNVYDARDNGILLIKEVLKRMKSIPEGTLLYEKGKYLIAAIETGSIWWKPSKCHEIRNYSIGKTASSY